MKLWKQCKRCKGSKCGEIGVKVMMDLCLREFYGREMLGEWKTSVIVPIFKGKGVELWII